MMNLLVLEGIYNRNVNLDKMMMVYLNLCTHNHFGIELFCPNRDVV